MAVKVENLYKDFGEKNILKNISLQVKKGEIVTVVGPSGAGKTTLIRCINGLEKPSKGTIKIEEDFLCKDDNGKIECANKKQAVGITKKVGYVFQDFGLFPHMTVMENIIEAPISVNKVSKEAAKKQARSLLEGLGLKDKESSYPFQLSGGEKQRVAIARACALNPILMCFDEPTSALDPEMREGIATIIEDLARNNMAILIITHDMVFAKRISDRMLFIEKGQLIAEGNRKNNFEDMDDERLMTYINS